MLRRAVTDQPEFPKNESHRLQFAYSEDMPSDNLWLEQIQAIVKSRVPNRNAKIGVIGMKKDKTSYYLDMFPQWKEIKMEQVGSFDATAFRAAYYEGKDMNECVRDGQIAPSTCTFLTNFKKTAAYAAVVDEYEAVKKEKAKWAGSPYPVIFVTTDAVVVQSGHVLMVQRKFQPGKGLLALPGGFLKEDQTLLESMLRELKEETRLKVPAPILRGSISDMRVFDKPDRSLRGRTVTHAYYIELTPDPSVPGLPVVKGSDDARKAQWISLADIDSLKSQIFEDHYDIIQHFVSRDKEK
jgi:bifunctional NMN adenylyltransferase/nudix hydrolase